MNRTLAKMSDLEIANSLQGWIKIATRKNLRDGKRWYRDAQKFTRHLAKFYDLDRYIVAGCTSALSPNNRWERNKFDVEQMIQAFKWGRSINSFKVCTYGANKRKAWRILSEGATIVAKSPKTHAFAMNIGRLSDKHVTIDMWHIRACLCTTSEGIVDDVTTSITPNQYRRVEAITARVAQENKLKPYQAQAVIWVAIKEAWNR